MYDVVSTLCQSRRGSFYYVGESLALPTCTRGFTPQRLVCGIKSQHSSGIDGANRPAVRYELVWSVSAGLAGLSAGLCWRSHRSGGNGRLRNRAMVV